MTEENAWIKRGRIGLGRSVRKQWPILMPPLVVFGTMLLVAFSLVGWLTGALVLGIIATSALRLRPRLDPPGRRVPGRRQRRAHARMVRGEQAPGGAYVASPEEEEVMPTKAVFYYHVVHDTYNGLYEPGWMRESPIQYFGQEPLGKTPEFCCDKLVKALGPASPVYIKSMGNDGPPELRFRRWSESTGYDSGLTLHFCPFCSAPIDWEKDLDVTTRRYIKIQGMLPETVEALQAEPNLPDRLFEYRYVECGPTETRGE